MAGIFNRASPASFGGCCAQYKPVFICHIKHLGFAVQVFALPSVIQVKAGFRMVVLPFVKTYCLLS